MTSIYDVGLWWWPRPEPVVDTAAMGDCETLATIHAEAFHRGWGPDDLAAMLRERNVVGHVIRRRATASPAGFILSRIAADEAEILTVAVSRRLRGRGYGGRLLNAHVPALMRAGVRQLFLEVEGGNAPAIALYERAGFETIGRRKGYYRTPSGTADALTMRRTLPPL